MNILNRPKITKETFKSSDIECIKSANVICVPYNYMNDTGIHKNYYKELLQIQQDELQEISLEEALNSSYNFVLNVHLQDNNYDCCLTTVIRFHDDNIDETFTEEIYHQLTDLSNDEKEYIHNILLKDYLSTDNRCTICGKEFDIWDKQNSFGFHHQVHYGSKFDLDKINVKLCCDCFDNMMDKYILPNCKINPVQTTEF